MYISGDCKIIGESVAIKELFREILIIAPTESTVLITGERGSGKELAAKAIHYNSNRRTGEFVIVDCSILEENLTASDLFGHERGAFTAADKKQPGLLEYAESGTVFFDEIDKLSINLQSKLLRFLEHKTIRRIGGRSQIEINARIIAATNKNLKNLVDSGLFLPDLYDRLDVLTISVPPIRDRKEDIPLLARYFADQYAKINLKSSRNVLIEQNMEDLCKTDYPGNIRQLKNLIFKICSRENK